MARRSRAHPLEKPLFGLLLAALLLAALAAGLELGVRGLLDDGHDYTLEMWKYSRALKRVAGNPELGHEHVPGSRARLMGVDVAINGHGLRERELAFEKPAGVKRVLMLGDSLTFGWGVESGATTSQVLERELNSMPGPARYEVINTGVGNYNTAMEVAYFFAEGRRYSPDVVVLNYFVNDAEPTPHSDASFLSEHSAFWAYAGGQLDAIARRLRWGGRTSWDEYYRSLYEDEAPGWRAAREAARKLGAWCHAQPLRCVLVNQPELHELEPYPFGELNGKIEQLAREAGLEYLDLLPVLKGEAPETLWVTRGDPHPNAKACALYGKAIYRYLKTGRR